MCCLELLCCCLGPKACGLCCASAPEAKSSITTRILYIVFLMVVVIVSSILLAPAISNAVANSFLCHFTVTTPTIQIDNVATIAPSTRIIHYNATDTCRQIFGYTSVYRICMGVASFFFVLMLMMLCVFSSRDPRSYVQNGFWFFKWLICIGIVVGFFFIPREQLIFSKVSLVIGMIGGFFFIVLQVVFLVDFAHGWAEAWLEKQKETENNWWYVALLIPTIIFYFLALAGIILLFVFFVRPGGCGLNIFFLCSIFILSVIVSIIAILPPVQNAQPTSGLLQASIVALYTTYLAYSALSNEPYGPNDDCPLIANTTTNVSGINVVSNVFSSGTNEIISSVFGIAILFITVGYASIYLSNNKQIQKLRGNHKDESEGYTILCCDKCCPDATEASEQDNKDVDGDDENTRWRSVDDEKEHVTYSYSFFHFMMVISTLFIMMQLTNWYNPYIAESDRFQNTWASVWIKMASAWICFAIYLWTLLAPLILRNRDFGYGVD